MVDERASVWAREWPVGRMESPTLRSASACTGGGWRDLMATEHRGPGRQDLSEPQGKPLKWDGGCWGESRCPSHSRMVRGPQEPWRGLRVFPQRWLPEGGGLVWPGGSREE